MGLQGTYQRKRWKDDKIVDDKWRYFEGDRLLSREFDIRITLVRNEFYTSRGRDACDIGCLILEHCGEITFRSWLVQCQSLEPRSMRRRFLSLGEHFFFFLLSDTACLAYLLSLLNRKFSVTSESWGRAMSWCAETHLTWYCNGVIVKGFTKS